MLAAWGLRGTEVVAATAAALGALITLSVLPEPKGRTLEQISARPSTRLSPVAVGAPG